MPEYQSHKAVIEWGEMETSEDKRAQIEQAIKALIDVLDGTFVESVTFSKLENNGNQENQESGGADGVA